LNGDISNDLDGPQTRPVDGWISGYLGPWDVIGGCQGAKLSSIPLQDVNQVGQVAVPGIQGRGAFEVEYLKNGAF